jgi:hypothetical protein
VATPTAASRSRAYRCVTKAGLKTDRCPYPGAVKKEWLESAVIDTVATVVGSPVHHRRMLAALDRAFAAARAEPESTLDSLTRQLADVTLKRDRLVAAVEQGTLLPEEASERLTAVRRLMQRLELQRATIALDQQNRDVLEGERDRIATMGRDFRRAASTLEGPALRELIRPWIAGPRSTRRPATSPWTCDTSRRCPRSRMETRLACHGLIVETIEARGTLGA